MGFIPSRLYFRHKQLSILTKVLMVNYEVFFWADAGWKGDFKVRIYWCITCSYLPVILSQALLQRANARNVHFFTLYRWPIYVFNWVVNTKLLTLPPTQHHSFFRNLPPLFCHRVYFSYNIYRKFCEKVIEICSQWYQFNAKKMTKEIK